MSIVLGGPESSIVRYGRWIEQSLPVGVILCSDPGSLLSRMREGEGELLVLDCSDGRFHLKEILPLVRGVDPATPVLVLGADDGAEKVVEAFQLGASDYLLQTPDRGVLLERIRANMARSRREPVPPAAGHNGSGVPERLLFGDSPAMKVIREVVDKVKDTDLPLLITGESGTGKEMLARYIWQHSERSGRPFVKINCASIPSELLESELFGFEKGAFTGAYRRKAGKFEAAEGGVFFLDEISELLLPLQSKLLHVLQDGQYSELGSNRENRVDVRVIVATNRSLEEEVRKSAFRQDLYFRLNVVHLHIPPLRERPGSLPLLIDYFLDKFSLMYGREKVRFSDTTLARLQGYQWPGNIRELENLVRRVTVLGDECFVLDDLPGNGGPAGGVEGEGGWRPESVEEGQQGPGLKEIAKRAALEAEREMIARVLAENRWNRKKTASCLGISYKTLLSKIKETGLKYD